MIKLKRTQTPVFPSNTKYKPYPPHDFQCPKAQNVVNFEFIPSTGTIHPTISRAQPRHSKFSSWRVPEHSKHLEHRLWGISGCSELPFLGSPQGGSSWGELATPQREGPAVYPDLAQPHHPQPQYAPCSIFVRMEIQKKMVFPTFSSQKTNVSVARSQPQLSV